MEKLGAKGNTTLSVKKVEISQKEKNTVLVGVLIRGTFSDVMQTIALIENMPYKIHITSSYVNQQEKQAEIARPLWQADVSFNILSSS
jgi:hypothetical protein